MSTLQNQLATREREEVGRAVRGLLRTPWVTQDAQPALLDLVRRRRTAVTRWFDYYLGWDLHLHSEQGYVRLVKVPGHPTAAGDLRPLRRRRTSAAPFDRLRYVLLCVAAAEVLDARMVTVGELADRVAHACATDEALPAFRTDRKEHRRAFVDAVVILEDLRALVAVDGQTLGFADDATTAVLYRVDAQALHHLVAAPHGPSFVVGDTVPSTADAIDAMTDEPHYGPDHRRAAHEEDPTDGDPARPTSAQRNRWARHSLLRSLFDDAAVHVTDMTAAQRAYAASITGRDVVRQAAQTAGFVLEERAEGYLLVDPDRASGPDVFPGDGAASAAGLHILTLLLARGAAGVTHDEVVEHVGVLLEETPNWARTYRDDGGASRLVAEALELMAGHQLVLHDLDTVHVRPAAARYRDVRWSRGRQRHRGSDDATDRGTQDTLLAMAGSEVGP